MSLQNGKRGFGSWAVAPLAVACVAGGTAVERTHAMFWRHASVAVRDVAEFEPALNRVAGTAKIGEAVDLTAPRWSVNATVERLSKAPPRRPIPQHRELETLPRQLATTSVPQGQMWKTRPSVDEFAKVMCEVAKDAASKVVVTSDGEGNISVAWKGFRSFADGLNTSFVHHLSSMLVVHAFPNADRRIVSKVAEEIAPKAVSLLAGRDVNSSTDEIEDLVTQQRARYVARIRCSTG